MSGGAVYALSLDGQAFRYVGCTIRGVDTRLRRHRWNARNRPDAAPVYRWMVKHGIENVVATVLDECTKDDLGELEQTWIALLRADGFDLLNCNAGGVGIFKPATSDEARRKMSESQKLLWTPERRQHYSDLAYQTLARPGVMDAIRDWHTPERRAEQSERIADINRSRRGIPKSDSWREATAARWARPGERQRHSKAAAAAWTPERHRRHQRSMHERWHVNRQIVNSTCEFCEESR